MLDCNYVCIPYIFDNTYVTYAFSMTGGSLLKWFRDNFARLDKEKTARQGKDIYAVLDEDMPKKPTDLFVLPHFAGAQGMHTDIRAKGAIINLDFNTRREDIYRACMEGETFEMKRGIETLKEEGIYVNELRAVGGGARSARFMQIRADILEKPIITMECEEAGTLGTAILAGRATGIYKTVHEAGERFVKTKTVFEPIAGNSDYYRSRFEKYIRLYDMMKQVR